MLCAEKEKTKMVADLTSETTEARGHQRGNCKALKGRTEGITSC